MNFKNFKLSILLLPAIALFACTPQRGKMIKERPVEKTLVAEDIEAMSLEIKDAEISYCKFNYLNKHQATHMGDRIFGGEYTHGYLTIRTQDKSRAGMYCYVMLSGVLELPKGTTIELSVDVSDKAKVKTYTFTVPQTECVLREVKLGITGKDWGDPKANVNAWKAVVKAPNGDIVAEKRSWLWSIKEERETRIF